MSLPGASDVRRRTDVYAEVALLPALPGKDLLTYRVPAADVARVRPGMRVLVPLGRRRETAVVVALGEESSTDVERVRAIEALIDTEPIVSAEIVALCRWAAGYYVTSLADVLAAALPGGLRAKSARLVRLVPAAGARPPASPLEQTILAHLRGVESASPQQIGRALGRAGVARAIDGLARRGLVTVEDVIRRPTATTRWTRVLAVARELEPEEVAALGRRAPRQAELYARLSTAPARRLAADELPPGERTAATALVRRGVLRAEREERYRRATTGPATGAPPPVLTDEQRAAVDAVAACEGFRTFLLHGVTGSGKTEVYLQLTARARAAGRSALLLVPEIALTHQLVQRVQERFGAEAAVLHSGLGPGERWDEWRRIIRGDARVVVGTRSALFAPLVDLGLVVVDEEHDGAYKQDEGLRYHARDLAVVRAKLAGVPAVLGSATPSVESHQQALDGKFQLLTLRTRIAGRTLPAVEVVDLRLAAPMTAAPDAPPSRLFSRALLAAIEATLGRGEQVLLFLNRRGFAKTMQCLRCGEPVGCPSCSVSLTWHQRRGVLLCHHCGHARPERAPCAACRHTELRSFGDGTERVEEEVGRLFPGARVARLDRDTSGRPRAQRRILDAWRAGALDVLIGTQMVAKGHDVPGVTLVGVVLADVALNMPDFRAGERAFQLLTQVAGRAGRGVSPGRVVVQTYRTQHHSLVTAAAHDYAAFASRELAFRRELGYPPFARLAVLRLEGVDAGATERAASACAIEARASAATTPVTVRGPAPAPLERLRGRYRWQVLLSSTSVSALRAVLRRVLAAWYAGVHARRVRLVVDVDPVSML